MPAPTIKTKFFVSSADDIPRQGHFAIFESSSHHIPGSGEWAPGHGYPAHDENFVKYTAYLVEEEFIADMLELKNSRMSRSFRGMWVSAPYTFETLVKQPDALKKPVLTYPRD